MKVTKRNGSVVDYDRLKIKDAITKAFIASKEVKEKFIPRIVEQVTIFAENYIATELKNGSQIDVETIQDKLEDALIVSGGAKTAKGYIRYRDKRHGHRVVSETFTRTMHDIIFSASTDVDLKRENANIDADTSMGAMLKVGSEASKAYCLENLLDSKHADAHKRGDIHIHDLDFLPLTLTCCQIDLLKLFKGGFNTGHASIFAVTRRLLSASVCLRRFQRMPHNQFCKFCSIPLRKACQAAYFA